MLVTKVAILILLSCLSEAVIRVGLVTTTNTQEVTLQALGDALTSLQSTATRSVDLKEQMEIFWEHYDVNSDWNWEWPKRFEAVCCIIDVSNDMFLSQFFAYEAIKRNLLHQVVERRLDEANYEMVGSQSLFLESRYSAQAFAFIDLMNKYGWSEIAMIYSQKPENLVLAETFRECSEKIENKIKIQDELILDLFSTNVNNAGQLKHRLQSTTKHSKARIILVMVDTITATNILNAADESVMGGSGYAWILSQEAITKYGETARNSNPDRTFSRYFGGVIQTGAIGFTEESESIKEQYPIVNVDTALKQIAYAYKITGSLSGSTLRNYLLTNPSIPSVKFPVIFDKEGVRVHRYVMQNIEGIIHWPGQQTSIPNTSRPPINLALLVPLTTHEGDENDWAQQIVKVFRQAIDDVENNGTIPGYQLIGKEYDTRSDNSTQEVTRILNIIQAADTVGIVGPLYNDETKAYLEKIETDQLEIPVVSYAATFTNFSRHADHPNFLRTIQPDSYQSAAISMFLQHMEWNYVGLVYTNDDYGLGLQDFFQSNANGFELKILNDPEYQSIPSDYTEETLDAARDRIHEVMVNIVEKHARIIVYFGNAKMGLEVCREGKLRELSGKLYMYVGAMWLDDNTIQMFEDHKDKNDIWKAIQGAVGIQMKGVQDINPNENSEPYQWWTEQEDEFGNSANKYIPYVYDSVELFAKALDNAIIEGKDFNDGKQLMEKLRSVEMSGKTGLLKFPQDDTNDREAIGYKIVNWQEKDKILPIFYYNPLEPQIFDNQTNGIVDPVFGGGKKGWGNKPVSFDDGDYNCPFEKHMERPDGEGIGILIGLSLALLILTLILCWFSYRKWSQLEIHKLNGPVVRSWRDTAVQATIAIEFFQFIAIAPVFKSLNTVVKTVSNVFMLDIVKIFGGNQDKFWQLCTATCICCYAWFGLVMLIMANVEEWLSKFKATQRIMQTINAILLPFYGNTCFLPVISILLDTFVCVETAQGSAFVARDCWHNCWNSSHYPYVAMCTLALACYHPIAVFSRPLWQQARTGLNLLAKPSFLLFKTTVQVLLVVVTKLLQTLSKWAHGVVFSVLFAAFTFLTYKIEPFNYGRCNLWEIMSLIGILWMSVLATVSLSYQSDNIAWFVVLMIGWMAVAISTYFIQKKYFPENYLVSASEGKSKRKVYDYALSVGLGGVFRKDNQIHPAKAEEVVEGKGVEEEKVEGYGGMNGKVVDENGNGNGNGKEESSSKSDEHNQQGEGSQKGKAN